MNKPAFPRPGIRSDGQFHQDKWAQEGMTIREYASIKAMQAFLGNKIVLDNWKEKAVVSYSIKYADALIKELHKEL